MRYSSLSKLRSYLLPALAAIVLATGPAGCSSSGEESPSPALEGAASGEQADSGNAASNAASGENASANANTEAANTAKPEGAEAASSNNPIGNELNNAISGEGNVTADGKAASGAAPENNDGALNAEGNTAANMKSDAGATAAATRSNEKDESPIATAADANSSNPFASGNAAAAATPPVNAAPQSPSADAYPAAASAPAAASSAAEPPAASESSAAPSGPTSLPEIGSKMAYYVMRGDTLAAIAQKIYGSKKGWKALQTENGLTDPNKIYPGDVIYFTLDESSKAFAEKYEMGARQVYTVSKGDSLAKIAGKFYGTQGAWRALWKENPQILNPDRIRVGMVLSYRTASKVALKDENEIEEDSESESGFVENTEEQNQVTAELATAAMD